MANHKNDTFISPIAIDLGAKNTGVYFAHYKAGSSLEDIKKEDKEGKVYQLEKDKYTLLMANRTAARHQRRGYDRRQMAKRLFKLIWCEHLGLEWNDDTDTQQTISFLLNRRGFSFLTEEYDADILKKKFPQEAYDLLPDELKIEPDENGAYNFADALTEWANEGEKKVGNFFNAINKEPKRIAQRQVFIGRTKKLREYCEKRKNGDAILGEKKKILENLSRWIWDEWRQAKVQGLNEDFIAKDPNNGLEIEWKKPYSFNLVIYLNQQKPEVASQILDSLPDTSAEESDLKKSVWNFKAEKFKLEDKGFLAPELPDDNAAKEDKQNYEKAVFTWKQNHIQHLAFALQKIHEELRSGGCHRSKYFEEIEKILKQPLRPIKVKGKEVKRHHLHEYLNNFCSNLHNQQEKKFGDLCPETLANLIGHISNLELKPLRKYFNDKKHLNAPKRQKKDSRYYKGDYWYEPRLKKYFDNWILREWRVGEKDKDKAKGKPQDYNKLKESWKHYKDDPNKTVVDFWLEENPILTIPPYQDNNNRRPPKCQSLILNPRFLDNKYQGWQNWLRVLEEETDAVKQYIGEYRRELEALKSGKGKPYFGNDSTGQLRTDSGRRNMAELDARVLQFILDRTKDSDPLKLNEIYSRAKQIKQCKRDGQDYNEAKKELGKALNTLSAALEKNKGLLPESLKPNYDQDDLFPQDSFLHLICKYYKLRQKARDGRLFIHPEYRLVKGRGYQNTGRFDDKGHLLTYCNHKPRQKRYQSFYDVAGVLQVSPQQLGKVIGSQNDADLEKWLKDFKGLQTLCRDSDAAQKEHRGELKSRVYIVVKYSKKQDKLFKLDKNAREIAELIGKKLFDEQGNDFKKKVEKFHSIFSFAQIQNIVFADRSGNANTCLVCSTDNAQRMQTVPTKDGKDITAKAQRLPAIPTRLIDGAVMRMARIVGDAIAKDKWEKIKQELQDGKRVRVPIITESNRFEFEPSKEEIVKGQRPKSRPRKGKVVARIDAEKIFKSKEDRIKSAANNLSAYSDTQLQGDKFDSGLEDLDHIIPRSHRKYGTLNDEANLICVTKKDNVEKGNSEYFLKNLGPDYKKAVFKNMEFKDGRPVDHKDDSSITNWIVDQIGNGQEERFEFGPYRNFLNLTTPQQIAFRHALFLPEGHDLRKKVINAIDHRTKTLVNGTQRYFAEVLANSLYKLAKREKLDTKKLTFDYFGVEALDNTRGDGIYNLRKELVEIYREDLKEYEKKEGATQKLYSHLIDAQVAFCMVAAAHRGEGGLKLNLGNTGLWSRVDKETGEIKTKDNKIYGAELFDAIQVTPKMMDIKPRKRRKVYDIETHHRQLLEHKQRVSISYQIHRDGMIAEKFFPLLKDQDGVIKKGFHPSNSTTYNGKDFDRLQPFLQELHNRSQNYDVWVIKKREAQDFLMKFGSHKASQDEKKLAKLLDGLSYQTVKKSIQSVLHEPNPKTQTMQRIKNKNLPEKEQGELLKSIKKPPETVGDALLAWDCFVYQDKFKKDNLLLPVFYQWKKLKAELELADESQSLHDFLENCSLFSSKKHHPHQKVKKVYSLPVLATIGNIRLKRKSWDGTAIIQTVPEESLAKYGYDGKDRPHTILSRHSVPKKHYLGESPLKPQPTQWVEVPATSTNDIKVEIQHKDAGRCLMKITTPSIDNISLPPVSQGGTWEGKVLEHETKEELKNAISKSDTNHHILKGELKWFNEIPFTVQFDRGISIHSKGENYVVECTISKSKKTEKLLLNEQ